MIPQLLLAALGAAPDAELFLVADPAPVPIGCTVDVELRLTADGPLAVAAVDALLVWDPLQLELVQAFGGDEDWFVAAFLGDPDGINDDVLDGVALFTALSNPGSPLPALPELHVATLRYKVLADGAVDLLPSLGLFGDSEVIGTVPGLAVPTSLGPPVAVDGEPAPAAELVRLGVPPNPDALQPSATGGPVIGTVWDTSIDHTTFLPDALLDVIVFAPYTPALNVPTIYGVVLIDLMQVYVQLYNPSGAPFLVPVPPECALVGVELSVQGVSLSATNVIATNALDLRIGTS
jgi:hypothetical protein